MQYNDLIKQAIEKKEILNLLRGDGGYEIEVSKFTSDIFPTDVNEVLVNCFYKQVGKIDNIKELFIDSIEELLKSSSTDVYISILYFDTCIFQEEIGKASFKIDRNLLAQEIKFSLANKLKELEGEIIFANGMKKNNPLKNILNFNDKYAKKFGFSIMN